jgi:hypothetical protein
MKELLIIRPLEQPPVRSYSMVKHGVSRTPAGDTSAGNATGLSAMV